MSRRTEQRRAAVFALYQADLTGRALDDAFERDAAGFTRALAHATADYQEELDATIARHARGWALNRIAPLERAILRVALLEMLHPEVTDADVPIPPEGAIDEAVETAKEFCGADAPGFVNGVLGAALREARAAAAAAATDPGRAPPRPVRCSRLRPAIEGRTNDDRALGTPGVGPLGSPRGAPSGTPTVPVHPFPGAPLPHDHRARHRRGAPASFRCRHCRLDVPFDAPGTAHRNHCPSCLWSRHLDDDTPGDRAAECGASMEPIAVSVRTDGEWQLVHRCAGCDELHVNRIAGDDNPLLLTQLAVRPLARPPFPLEHLARI